jgi:hypothetical protein
MQTRKERFLAMAKEAEKAAAEAITPELKEGWFKIARSYRDLAEGIRD